MPSYQHEKHFTLDEARELIPWLTENLVQIQLLFEELGDRGFDAVNVRWKPKGNGHSDGPPPDEYNQFIKLVGELDRAGVLIKNFKKCVVDIPHIRPDGEEVYLCWMLGESAISFWHRIPDGFMGRVPIENNPD